MTYVAPQYPVNAEFIGNGEWASTGLDYSDYANMATHEHKLAPHRTLETPQWAVNDSMLREVVVVYLERRADMRQPGIGTMKERLEKAEAILLKKNEAKHKVLIELCKRFPTTTDPIARRKLEIQIENLDTSIRLAKGGPSFLLGVVYYYYRCGMDSVGVALQLKIKPPHVRGLLYRLNKAAEIIQSHSGKTGNWDYKVRISQKPRVKIDMIEAARLNAEGTCIKELAAHFKVCPDTIRNNFHAAGVEYTRHNGRKPAKKYRGPRIRINLLKNWEPPMPSVAVLFGNGVVLPAQSQAFDIELAARMNAEGKTLGEIAQHFNCWTGTVAKQLKKNGINIITYNRGGRRPYATDVIKERTIMRHVLMLEGLAARNGGTLPETKWLWENGYSYSYQVMLNNPDCFKHIKRSFGKQGRPPG